MESSRLLTHSIKTAPGGERIGRILAAALQAVDPETGVRQALLRPDLKPEWESRQRIWVVGAGKAGAPMAHAAFQVLGELITGGAVVVKEGHAALGKGRALPPEMERIMILEAAHPAPDQRGVQASQQIAAVLDRAGEDDLVLCLLSGGGSALLTSPAPGVTLADLQALTRLLLASGAPIEEINALRKHLDILKGGGLARRAAPARVLALILSDVVGDALDVIASGPTVADPTTWEDCLAVLARRDLVKKVPAAVYERLRQGQAGSLPDTPKPGDPIFERVCNVVTGSSRIAALAALGAARQEGFHTLLLTTYLQGEAREAGRVLASLARQIALHEDPLPRPAVIIAAGETTVTVQGDGLGGRNQELALAAALDLDGLENVLLVSLATDGGDGPTPAAGAVASGATLTRARQLGLDPRAFLARSDSFHFFAPLEDLLLPGPTLTNVNDLILIAIL
jgi:glycerate 2-kinase